MLVALVLFFYLLGDITSWFVGAACVIWYLQDKHPDLHAELLRRRAKHGKEKESS